MKERGKESAPSYQNRLGFCNGLNFCMAKEVGVPSPHKSNILVQNSAIEIKETVGLTRMRNWRAKSDSN